MARLIDADKLLTKVVAVSNSMGNVTCSAVSAMDILTAPTVDAVEVVRCRDCKHKGWVQEPCHGKSIDHCRIWDSCLGNLNTTFCSYGERKDGDGNG